MADAESSGMLLLAAISITIAAGVFVATCRLDARPRDPASRV